MTDVGSASVKITGDVRTFAREAERELDRALSKMKPIEVPVEADTEGLVRGLDGKLRDSRGRFVGAGGRAGEGFTEGFNKKTGPGFVQGAQKTIQSLLDVFGAGLSSLPVLIKPALVVAGLGIAAGIAAAIGPVLGGLISASILAAGGLGVIGIGAMLLKEEPALVRAAEKLMNRAKAVFTRAAKPLLEPLVDALGIFERLTVRIGPQIRAVFASIAPAIVPFAEALAGMVKTSLPGFTKFVAAAMPFLTGMAAVLPGLGADFGDFFAAIASAAPAATAFFQDFLRVVGGSIAGIGAGLAWLTNQYETVRGSLIEGFGAIKASLVDFWDSVQGGGPGALAIFRDFMTGVGAAIAVIGRVIGVLTRSYPAIRENVISAFQEIRSAIEGTVNFIRENSDWLGPLTAGIAAIAAAWGLWTAAVTVWSTVVKVAIALQAAWNAVLALSPIGLIALAITGLVAALIYFFTQTETGRKIWAATWGAIQAAVAVVVDWFTGTALPAIQTAWNAILTAAQVVAAWYQQNLAPVFQAAGELIMAVFQRVAQAATFLWNVVLRPQFELIAMAWQLLWTGAKAAWDVFGPTVLAAIQAWVGVVQAIWTTTWNVLVAVAGTAFNIVKTTIQTVLAVIAGIIRTVAAVIRGDWSGAWNAMKATVTSVLNGVNSIVSSVLNGIRNVVMAVLNGIRSAWSAAWNAFGPIVSAAVGRVRSAVNSIRDVVMGALSGAAGWLVSAGRRIIDGLVNGIQSGFDRVRGLLSTLTGMLPDWKGPAAVDQEILYKSGQMVMGSFEDGLRNRFGDIERSLRDFTGDLPAFTTRPRGGDGASAAAPTWNGDLNVTINGQGAEAGEEAADAVLEKLAQAGLVR